MRPLHPETVAALRTAMAYAQRGDHSRAIASAKKALAAGRDPGVLHALLGMLACRSGDLPTGIDHLRRAHAADRSDTATRANLAQALIETGAGDEALTLCTREAASDDPTQCLRRIRAHLLQERGLIAEAIETYAAIVAARPDDWESWNNLGNAQSAAGDAIAALEALTHASRLRPDLLPVRLNHASAIAAAGREAEAAQAFAACAAAFPHDARPLGELGSLLSRLHRDGEAMDVLTRAVAMRPTDPGLSVRLGEQCVASFQVDRAEAAFRTALTADPIHADAHVQLAILYEHGNRIAELAMLVARAEAAGLEAGALGFLRALLFRRQGRFQDGLDAMAVVPVTLEPGRRAQMIGQFRDRLGDVAGAFAAFSEMNRLNALDPTGPAERARGFRQALAQATETVTSAWYAGWRAAEPAPADYRSPVFLVGFPRSGTTLLDTILMGHPDAAVLEELPPLRRAEDMVGGLEALAMLDDATLMAARAAYFEEARRHVTVDPTTVLIDKLPMNMNKAPLIHRLFPDARFILALRHPCDVVLSCFMTTFRLNNAMANFLDLRTTTETYDLAFRLWERCRAVLPMRVHTVIYEDAIADQAATLKPLFEFLGLAWDARVLDHRATAATRPSITTASYAQVTEPLYRRAVARWESYRPYLADVLPVLAPWVERHGYPAL